MAKFVYVSKTAPGFYCNIVVGEKDIRQLRCVNSQFITEDEAFAKAIDYSIDKYSIGMHLRKVDESAAAEWAAKNLPKPAAVSGGVTAAIAHEQMKAAVQAGDKAMEDAAKLNPNIVADLDKELQMQKTEQTAPATNATVVSVATARVGAKR